MFRVKLPNGSGEFETTSLNILGVFMIRDERCGAIVRLSNANVFKWAVVDVTDPKTGEVYETIVIPPGQCRTVIAMEPYTYQVYRTPEIDLTTFEYYRSGNVCPYLSVVFSFARNGDGEAIEAEAVTAA